MGKVSFSSGGRGHYSITISWSGTLHVSVDTTKTIYGSKYTAPQTNQSQINAASTNAYNSCRDKALATATGSKSGSVTIGGKKTSVSGSHTWTAGRKGVISVSKSVGAGTITFQGSRKDRVSGNSYVSKSGSTSVSIGHKAGSISCSTGGGFSGSATISYGKWPSYTISYKGNGSTSGKTPASQTKWKDESLKLKSCPYSKTGYHFKDKKWHVDGSGGPWSFGGTMGAGFNRAATLYPRWEANNYYIYYYDGEHPGVTTLSGSDVGKRKYTYDEHSSYPSCTWSSDAYTFAGWNTKKDGSGTTKQPGADIFNLTDENNKVLDRYAVWTAKSFTITYYANKGNVAIEPAVFTNNSTSRTQSVDFYDEYNLLTADKLKSRLRYEFLGWSTDSTDVKAEYSAGKAMGRWTKTNNNTAYYAIWKDLYKEPVIKNHIKDRVFRCDSTGVEKDDGTYLHIKPINVQVAQIGTNHKYTTTITVSYTPHGTLGATSIATISGTGTDGILTLTERNITDYTFDPELEYDIMLTVSHAKIQNSSGQDVVKKYSSTEKTMIYTAVYPLDIRSDQEMIGIQVSAPSANQGFMLAGPTATKARDIYLDIDDTKYAEDEDLITAASLMNVKSYPNQGSTIPMALDIRDDGNFMSFGKQTYNLLTTTSNNGGNKAYYGLVIENGNRTQGDIYYDLNNSALDNKFAQAYNVFNTEKITTKYSLPSGYRQVPYIESTLDQNQYIDTGYNLSGNLTTSKTFQVTMVFQQTEPYTTNRTYLSISSGSTNIYPEFTLYLQASTGKIGWARPSSSSSATVVPNILSNQVQHTVTAYYKNGAHYLTIDGTKTSKTDSLSGIPSGTIYLFATHYSNSSNASYPVGRFMAMKLYSCYFKLNGTTVANFVPCVRESDEKPGLYDVTRHQFYTNMGEGDDFETDSVLADNLETSAAVTQANTADFTPIEFYKDDDYLTSIGGKLESSQLNSADTIATVNLPDGYDQLEYVQQTGKNYLNSGYALPLTGAIYVDFEHIQNTYQGRVFGASNQSSTYGTNVYDVYNNGAGLWAFSAGTTLWTSTLIPRTSLRTRLLYNLSTKKIAFGGGTVLKRTFTIGGSVAPKTIYFGAGNLNNSSVANLSKNKFYRIIMMNNATMNTTSLESTDVSAMGTIMRDFIPCRRNSDGKVGFYERINGTFYGPSGTGDFLAGPKVNKKTGIVLQKGTIVGGMPQSRDIYIRDNEFEELAKSIFGNDIVENFSSITFSRTSGGTTNCGYEPGMTWQDLVEDNVLNTLSLAINEEDDTIYLTNTSNYVIDIQSGQSVLKTDTLSKDLTYCFADERLISFTIAGESYQAISNISWSVWFRSAFNTNENLVDEGNHLFTFSLITVDADDEGTATTTNVYNYVSYNGTYVNTTEAPVANRAYVFVQTTSAEGDGEGGQDDGAPSGDDPDGGGD